VSLVAFKAAGLLKSQMAAAGLWRAVASKCFGLGLDLQALAAIQHAAG
jgi:hypothetical protein